MPDWLQPFTVNLEDLETHVPAHSSERDNPDSEGNASKVGTQKRRHNISTHFPKNRKRSIPRAEKFDDLITAEHKVLNERSESRNNHRYAVVVQVLANQWIQSYPCKTKTSRETEKNLRKCLEPSQKPKVIYTDNSKEFGKSCEELSWSHRTATPHRSETSGIAERAVRRVKEETSAVLLQSQLNEKWWSDSMECYCYLRDVQESERRFGESFK